MLRAWTARRDRGDRLRAHVRALVRDRTKGAQLLSADTELVVGDVTRPETLPEAGADVDAIVLTLGSFGTGASTAREPGGLLRCIPCGAGPGRSSNPPKRHPERRPQPDRRRHRRPTRHSNRPLTWPSPLPSSTPEAPPE
ncbi:NAD(P)H-binding protein [Streptomyces sp. NBC_01718]|uniref:NAD(P)H-binding protein n=1 Tax=Streptomyces sp. NBC_01718 TaxID=2975919 RepID=UPI00352EB84B